MSKLRKNVLRGLHGDSTTWKLIDCPQGIIYVAVVNCNPYDKNFGQWEGIYLDQQESRVGKQILVPPMFGLGHVVLSDEAIFHYKQSTYYNLKNNPQFTHRYDDSRFNI